MNRLTATVEALREQGEGAFMPFLVIGDPDLETAHRLVDALVDAGADLLEFGFPFSDPPADGPVIQAADHRALAAGVTPEKAFEFLAAVQSRHSIPVALLIYYNLILQYGVDAFYKRAAEAGVDAILVADLPLEESADMLKAANENEIAPIFIVTELSSTERIQKLAQVAQGSETHGHIGGEMSIHDVEMDHVGANGLEVGHLAGKVCLVGAHQRWRDPDSCLIKKRSGHLGDSLKVAVKIDGAHGSRARTGLPGFYQGFSQRAAWAEPIYT